MQTVQDAAALRAAVRGWRAKGQTVGFVPTMGNLHAGHQSLIRLARARTERVVASVFVNPTQFGPNEDFERYPRTLVQDQAALADEDCDLLFAPDVATIYPFGAEHSVSLRVPQITDTLEGAHRPGHFDGVATVVSKLLLQCLPDIAYFGEKDYQQLLVVRRMARDLDIPVKIEGIATMREPDGLALSSRNVYLSPEERRIAPLLYRVLNDTAAALAANPENVAATLQNGLAELRQAGFAPDYLELRDAADLSRMGRLDRPARLLAAAHLGRTRLIDNIPVDAA